jgi:hypothetical protein
MWPVNVAWMAYPSFNSRPLPRISLSQEVKGIQGYSLATFPSPARR